VGIQQASHGEPAVHRAQRLEVVHMTAHARATGCAVCSLVVLCGDVAKLELLFAAREEGVAAVVLWRRRISLGELG